MLVTKIDNKGEVTLYIRKDWKIEGNVYVGGPSVFSLNQDQWLELMEIVNRLFEEM